MSYLSDPRHHPDKQLPTYFDALPPVELFGAGMAFLDGGLWLSNGATWTEICSADGDQTVEGAFAAQGAATFEDAAVFEAGASFEDAATFEGAVQINAPLTTESESAGVTITGLRSTLDSAVVITAISKAAHAIITAADHGVIAGDKIKVEAVVGMTQINNLIVDVLSTDATHVTVDLASTGFTTYVSGGTLKKLLDEAFVTAAGHTFAVGDTVRFSGIVGMTELNGQSAVVTVAGSGVFTADIDVQDFTTYVSGGAAKGITEISTDVTGGLVVTSAIGTPATPAAGKVVIWWDETNKLLKIKDSAGTIETVIAVTA